MKRRQPIPQVEIEVRKPEKTFKALKERGIQGYVMSSGHLWLRGTAETIKQMVPNCKVIKSVGQPDATQPH